MNTRKRERGKKTTTKEKEKKRKKKEESILINVLLFVCFLRRYLLDLTCFQRV